MKLIKEFWLAIKFLLTFVGTYFLANVVYGVYIEYCYPLPDFFTHLIASQARLLLTWLNEPVSTVTNTSLPTVLLYRGNRSVLSIYEGCNGVNVVIVFVSFILAFTGQLKRKWVFITMGVLVIGLANVVRIILLYFVAIHYQIYFYFVHKYVFTLVLYAVVMGLWWVFVNRCSGKQKIQEPAA